MARSRRSPPMKDYRRAEEVDLDRLVHHNRERDGSGRPPRSPRSSRREDEAARYKGRDQAQSETYRSSRPRETSRESRRAQLRRLSPSPRRESKLQQPNLQRSRPLEERITRPSDAAPSIPGKPAKRRRTRSPSPAHSDRYIPPHRRESRSRERSDVRDRRNIGTDRAFSPRRTSPYRDSRSDRRVELTSSDSYVPSQRRRERSRTPPKIERWLRSPPRRSRSPRHRQGTWRQASPQTREIPPYSARALRTQPLSHSRQPKHSSTMNSTQRIQSIMDDPARPPSPSRQLPSFDRGSHDPMDGQLPMRQNFPIHHSGPHQNRPPRPMVDTRHSYSTSPPFVTPNSSYHGSPQSHSPFQGNRGGWHGQQQYHGSQG